MKDHDPQESLKRESEHTSAISGMFARIASDYDLMNRLTSGRRDVAWRRRTAAAMRFDVTRRYLDVATGTGDLAFDVIRMHEGVVAVGIDPVEELMEIGRAKARQMGLSHRMEFRTGNALALPFADGEFDAAGIAFGIRNIQDRKHALAEMLRVVQPGGQVLVLELTFSPRPSLQWLYSLYINRIIPLLASVFTNDPEAYRYLGRSIMAFPRPAEFMEIMRSAGLQRVEHHCLTFGAASLFIGYRPE